MMLAVERLEKSFGGVRAVHGCDFTVEKNSITALIGPNGAGKTTVFNLITGTMKADGGRIVLRGRIIDDEPHAVARLGIARTFQLLRIFPKLTVLENVMLAIPGRDERPLDRIFRPRMVHAEEARKERLARGYLGLVGLLEHQGLPAGSLSYGQQKLLDIARCLATEAELILLDEPVAGVNPVLRGKIKRIILDLKKRGKTVLLIEHDMGFVMSLADKIVVLDHGDEIAVGPPAMIRKDKRVIKAYLGEEA